MTLSSEMPQQFTPAPFSSALSAVKAKQHERDEIEELTREFLRKKGSIKQLGSGKDLIIEPVVQPDFERPKSAPKKVEPIQSPITLVPYKNRATHKSKHGQNIRANKDETVFWVQMAAIDLGKGQKWTKEQAIAARDKFRAASGLPPVDY